jgi:hypothetical protein
MVKGRLLQAAAIYETILLQDPTDLLAIRSCYDIYLVLGYVYTGLDHILYRPG